MIKEIIQSNEKRLNFVIIVQKYFPGVSHLLRKVRKNNGYQTKLQYPEQKTIKTERKVNVTSFGSTYFTASQ